MRISHSLNATFLRRVLDRACIAHDDFAADIQVSRSHFSAVLNGRMPLSKRMRRKLLESPLLQNVPQSDLWSESESEAAGDA